MKKLKPLSPDHLKARDDFYEWARLELFYSKDIVIRLLQEMGYSAFNVAEVEEYKEKLTEHHLNSRREELRKKLKALEFVPIPCPLANVPGVLCTGEIRKGICTIGGFSHKVAKLLMDTRGTDPVEFLKAYQEVVQRKASEAIST